MDDINKQLWNLIGSHDTSRFLTECNQKIERMKLAIVFQFTYIGVPYIYYGDEVGLSGGEEPQSRKCMIWNYEKQNSELLELYKKMIRIRKENKTLIYGDYKTIYCKDNVIAFIRKDKKSTMLIVINNTYKKIKIDLKINHEYLNIITGKNEIINEMIEVNPMDYKIFKR